MTNSSPEEKKPKKNKKKKGPIRFESIIPTCVFLGLIVAYYVLFFDIHLKTAIELGASYVHGAQVDIDNLKTSVLDAKVEIREIEVTNPDKPKENTVAISLVKMQLSWDALLRAKLVIEDSGIEGIRINSPRKNPGKIYKTEATASGNASSALKKTKEQLLDNSKEKFKGNVFGDAASILSGADPSQQLDIVRGSLETEKKIAELSQSVEDHENKWQKNLEQLPNKKKIEQSLVELKSLKFDSRNPKQFAESLKKGQAIIKENEKNFQQISKQLTELDTDLKEINEDIKGIDQARKDDIKNLQSRIQIPQLDTKTVAQLLFAQEIDQFQKKYGRYLDLGREYLAESPSSNDSTDQAGPIVPKKRSSGKNFKFTTKKSYPLFWLKQSTISSVANEARLTGNLNGRISNFSSDPKLVSEPGIIQFNGDFPTQNVLGIDAKITVDHRGEVPTELIDAKVDHYPVDRRDLSKSSEVQFGFNKATGRSTLTGKVIDKKIDLKLKNQLQKIDYYQKAKNKSMQELLTGITRDVPVITIDAGFTGNFRSPTVAIKSNLAAAIGASFRRQLETKIKEAKNKISNLVDDKVKAKRAELNARISQFQDRYKGEIEKLKKSVDSTKKKAQAEIDQAKKSQTKGLEKNLKKEAENLLKKLSF